MCSGSNTTQPYKDVLFSFVESIFFLILSIATCWDTIYSLGRRSAKENLFLQLQQVIEHEATSQQHHQQQPQMSTASSSCLDTKGPKEDEYIVMLLIEKVSALLLVMASFVAVVSLLVMTTYRRGYKRKIKDNRVVVDGALEDRIGVSLGSSAASLLLYNVGQCYSVVSGSWQDAVVYWYIMALLLAAVGLSFAVSCLVAAHHVKSTGANKVKTRCGGDDDPLVDLVHSYMKRIMVPMIWVTMFSTAWIVRRRIPTTPYVVESRHDNGHWIVAITGIFTFVQWILIELYGPGRMNRNVFSFGEWMVVSCLISVMATHYTAFYMVPKSWATSIGLASVPLSVEMVVAQAGILGCLIGSIVNLKDISYWMCRVCRTTKSSQGVWKVRCMVRLAIVVATVLYFIQIALWRSCHDEMQPCKSNHCQHDWCSILSTQTQTDTQNRNDMHHFLPILPFQWLFWFLGQGSYHVHDSIQQSHSFVVWPNYVWILYWLLVLSILTPIAILIAKQLNSLSTNNASDEDDKKKKDKYTVVCRKYFHLVAIVLFVPPTMYAHEMMSLTYAIAVCLLILLESIRLIPFHETFPSTHTTTSRHQKTMANSSSERCLIGSLTMKQFFEAFLDEKDIYATKGSFAFTHMALVIGCALPLWLQQQSCRGAQHEDILTPFVGIIVLGVGDAAGAVVGSMIGKHKWPHSKKSVEGSMVMLASMVISSILVRKICNGHNDDISWNSILHETAFLHLPLTVLEAVTLQIDNLCLPLVGYSLIKLKSR